MKYLIITILALGSISSLNAQKYKYYKNIMSKDDYKAMNNGLYAHFKTNKGEMLFELYEEGSPLTVANFVGLAEGTKENKSKKEGEPFYNGTIFHRIIKDFMIQGGDPQGTGMGDPGYKFADEKNDYKHDEKGYLSMANSGPNTNGSQFFITEVPTPWLDGRHTIFGKIVEGTDVLDAIAMVKTGVQDKPVEDVVLEEVTIIRKGDQYKKYNGGEAFATAEKEVEERNKKIAEELKAKKEAAQQANKDAIAEWSKNLKTTESGLRYQVLESTNGVAPKKGDSLQVHYKGMLENGTVFDSSYDRNEPIEFPAGVGKVIKGWDEGIMLLKEGEKAVFFIPSELGYGARGAGGVIPPNANLVFQVELVKVN